MKGRRLHHSRTAPVVALVVLAALWMPAPQASALTVNTILPPYTDTADGVPLAYWFDDFVSYQNNLLFQMQGLGLSTSSGIPLADLGDFSGTGVGTGNLDVLVATGALGADNDPVTGGLVFEDPIPTPTGGTDRLLNNNYWGLDDLNNDGTADLRNGPVTVGQVLTYLHLFDPENNIPVFVFDNNQAQGADNTLYVAGEVFIQDPVSGINVATWAVDGQLGPLPGLLYPALSGPGNDTFDLPTDFDNPSTDPAWVPAPNELTFTGLTYSYTVNNNRGSGANEFYVYAPSMNLALYDPSYLFGGRIYLANSTGGYEEIYLTGQVVPYITVIPEPATLGLGLIALVTLGATAWHRKGA